MVGKVGVGKVSIQWGSHAEQKGFGPYAVVKHSSHGKDSKRNQSKKGIKFLFKPVE